MSNIHTLRWVLTIPLPFSLLRRFSPWSTNANLVWRRTWMVVEVGMVSDIVRLLINSNHQILIALTSYVALFTIGLIHPNLVPRRNWMVVEVVVEVGMVKVGTKSRWGILFVRGSIHTIKFGQHSPPIMLYLKLVWYTPPPVSINTGAGYVLICCLKESKKGGVLIRIMGSNNIN